MQHENAGLKLQSIPGVLKLFNPIRVPSTNKPCVGLMQLYVDTDWMEYYFFYNRSFNMFKKASLTFAYYTSSLPNYIIHMKSTSEATGFNHGQLFTSCTS